MLELLNAIRDFRAALRSNDQKAIRIAAASLLVAIGDAWLRIESGNNPIGEGQDTVAIHDELCAAIEELGGEVPMGAGGAILSILIPILLKLLADRLATGGA